MDSDQNDDLYESGRLAVVNLIESIKKVEDRGSDAYRASWDEFNAMSRWMGRIHDTIVRQRVAKVFDSSELHALLVQTSAASHAGVDNLITSIEDMLQASIKVQMNVMNVNMQLWKQLDERPLSKKIWETAAGAVWHTAAAVRVAQAAKHANSVQRIYYATHDLQTRLRFVVMHLLDHQSTSSGVYTKNYTM